jgi:chromosome segregation ATPase
MLRAALIVVIVAGLAVVGLNFTKVSEKINTLKSDLDEAQKTAQAQTDIATKARAAEKKATTEAQKLAADLGVATNALNTASARAVQQEGRANRLQEEFDKTNRDRIEAQQQLSQWTGLGLSPDQIKALQANFEQATKERDAFTAENKILLRNNTILRNRLAIWEEPDKEVKLPALKAKIVAVDPKYDFVVLNVGSNQQVLTGGKLIVERDGRLLAKLRVTSVEPNRSIANILPDWKQGEVSEGDDVLTSYEALAQP